MEPEGERVATVKNLTLRRDVIEFHLTDGALYLGTPVAGRTVGAVFVGHGSVGFVPPLAVERRELKRVLGDSTINATISAATFLFPDSTLAELQRGLTFGPATVGGDARSRLHDALDRVLDGGQREVVQPTFVTALLNDEANGFFYAHVKREHGEDLMFKVDPGQDEQVELLRGGRQGEKVQVVSQFKWAQAASDSAATADPLKLEGTAIETTITKGLDFSAVTALTVAAQRAGVRWARFLLFSELKVDSVRDATGGSSAPGAAGVAATFFRADKSPELWLRFDPALKSGEKRSVRVAYHGELIGYRSVMEPILRRITARAQRQIDSLRGHPEQQQYLRRWLDSIREHVLPRAMDQWIYVKSAQTWFPRYATASSAGWPETNVELTFHVPTRYRVASIGRLADSHVAGDVVTTRWVTERPADQVGFNVGEFEEFKITDPRIPPVTIQLNGEGHRLLNQLILARSDPEREVGGDVANSLAFFTRVFGPPLFTHYYATEIPFFYGEAFPGLIFLSLETFQTVSEKGTEEAFRAHEMAHQWWGIGVRPASARDVWLSEGFADFSGLWYMQLILRDNEKFFKQLRERRDAIRGRRHDAPPIALGGRVHQTDVPSDYSLIIYQKGAWVLHMLRNWMINFSTMNEDAFTATMQDFYQQYRGRTASTADFQRVVEQHVGLPMGWFFHEWVEGTAIPTYILSWHADATQNGHYVLKMRVRQEDVPPDFEMPVPVAITLADGSQAFVRVNVRGPQTEGSLTLSAEPKALELNPLESVLAEVKTEGWH